MNKNRLVNVKIFIYLFLIGFRTYLIEQKNDRLWGLPPQPFPANPQ